MTIPATLPTARVAELDEVVGPTPWLVRSLWSEQAVGFVAGTPKSCKSWFGLDLAISVASNTPCLDRFEVEQPGRCLVYLAEDSLPQVRRRIAGICLHRRLDLQTLDLFVVTSPSLRLDSAPDQARLDATLADLRPRLVLLDPLVRLHHIDENSAAEISALLGVLRHLQRKYMAAIAVVHHIGKRSHSQLGQALRGSTDLHAWSDSAAYLLRKHDRLELALEHRSAPAPDPFTIELAADDPTCAHLRVCDDTPAARSSDIPEPPFIDLLRKRLADSPQPLSRATLRRELRVNNRASATLSSASSATASLAAPTRAGLSSDQTRVASSRCPPPEGRSTLGRAVGSRRSHSASTTAHIRRDLIALPGSPLRGEHPRPPTAPLR